MDRYIECKTQEQWNIVVEHLNKKYRCTAESRLDYLNYWVINKENTVLYDTGNYLWEYCSKDWYNRNRAAISFTTFEEFCKQEGINMKKKSTDYCFKHCKEFQEYCRYNNFCISGNADNWYYYNTTEDLQPRSWDCSSINNSRKVITWQEFKQLFIDKTMTTEQELQELKKSQEELNSKIAQIEAKIKEENEFKVGDIVVIQESGWGCGLIDTNVPVKLENISKCDTLKFDRKFCFLSKEGNYKSISIYPLRKATPDEITAYQEANKPIEISGYKAEFNKTNKTVSFGCKKDITKKDLEAILTVMKLNEKFDEYFTIGEEIIASQNEEDFTEEVTKETIQKLIDKLEE